MGYYDEVKARIARDGGVATANLGELREAIGSARLGPYVLTQVRETLHQEGIEYFPAKVLEDNKAPRQWEEVRLIRLDTNSPIYRAMKAIQEPSDDGDGFLRTLVNEGSATAEVERAQSKLERTRGAIVDALAILDEAESVPA